MPGIFGIYSLGDKEDCYQELKTMKESLTYDDDYSSGIYVDEGIGIYAGWCTNKGSFSDCQPIYNEKKDIILLYYGENSTELSLFTELKSNNHQFNKNNASYIVHMYEAYGDDFYKKLNGTFVGLIIDKRKGLCVLFNDRFGMQKMYYYQSGDTLYFSSEAKAILKLDQRLRSVETLRLAEHIGFGGVLDNKTIFNGISSVPGASVWEFRKGAVKKQKYFSVNEWETQPLLEDEFLYGYLKNAISNSMPNYFRGKADIGISLENGIDTILFNSDMRLKANKYPCYSFSCGTQGEVSANEIIANNLKQSHYDIAINKEFLTNFHNYVQKTIFITDGNLNVSESIELFYSQVTKQKAPIKISGKFGNTLFKPLPKINFMQPNSKVFNKSFNEVIHRVKNNYDTSRDGNPISTALFEYAPMRESARLALEQSQQSIRNFYFDLNLVSVIYRKFYNHFEHQRLGTRLVSDGQHDAAEILKVNKKRNRIILFNRFNKHRDELVARDFGNELVYQAFKGWFKEDLAEYAKEILLDTRTRKRNLFNMNEIEKMLNSHVKGSADRTIEITMALSIEQLHRILIEDL